MSPYNLSDKIIISLIAYQSLIFAIILLGYNRANNRSKRILGVYMVINLLYYGMSFFFYNNNFFVFDRFYYVIVPIVTLLQPYFYFYIKTLTDPHFKCTKKQIIHFLLGILILIMNVVLFSQLSIAEKKDLFYLHNLSGNSIYSFYFYLHTQGYHILLSIQALIYFVLIIRAVYIHKKEMPKNFSSYEGVTLNWLVTLLILFLSIIVLQEIFGNIKDISTNIVSRIIYNVSMLLILAFIGIAGIKQREIYIPTLIDADNKEENKNKQQKLKYQKSSLSDDEKQRIAKNLKKILEEEKLFLDNELRLDVLAHKLDTNRQYLSQIINEVYDQNFYSLINRYRIEEAEKMFFNKMHKQLSIMGIANSVGFNSKSTFNTLFKQFTGKTPSQFIKENNL